MKDKTISRVLAFFTVISAILALVAFAAVRNIDRSIAASDWVNHTHAVIQEIEGVNSTLVAANAAMLEFVVADNPRDSVACREALADLGEHLDVAKALTRSAPAQQAQVAELETLANRRADFIRAVLAAQKEHPETVRPLLAEEAGVGAAKEIARLVRKLKEEQMGLLAERDTAAFLQAQRTRWTAWLGAIVDLLLLAGVAWLIRDDLAARRRAASVLVEANATLETRVRERTSELAAANQRLADDNLERRWANQALAHQLHYNQLIVNSVTDAVLVLTRALNISRINPAVTHLTGWDAPGLVNQPLSHVVRLTASLPPAETPLIEPMAQALRDGHDLLDQPAVATDKRGQPCHVLLTLRPLRDGDKVVGGIAILRSDPTAAVGPTA